nr:DnaB-like helicase C-terminal domain-containing protein [Ilyobacter polytropus]
MVSLRKNYELRILATTLLSDTAAQEVAELSNKLFTGKEREFHKKISEIVKSGNKVEPGMLDQFDMEYLQRLTEVEFNSSNVTAYIDELKDTIKREFITKEITVILSDEHSTADMMLEKITGKLEQAKGRENPHYTEKLSETMNGIFDEIDNCDLKSDHLKTGYDNLDKRISFEQGDLVIIAARPAMGKTAYALNLTSKLCFQKHRGAFFSLEMDKKQLMKR